MPNLDDKYEEQDDLDIAARVMHTVERQVGSYRLALEKLRMLRKEFAMDEGLAKKAMADPESMSELLIQRGVPEHLAVGMAAEDFKSADFARGVGFWTRSCCCTACCLTSCNCTLITSIGAQAEVMHRS
jgi:hypothetical protein